MIRLFSLIFSHESYYIRTHFHFHLICLTFLINNIIDVILMYYEDINTDTSPHHTLRLELIKINWIDIF